MIAHAFRRGARRSMCGRKGATGLDEDLGMWLLYPHDFASERGEHDPCFYCRVAARNAGYPLDIVHREPKPSKARIRRFRHPTEIGARRRWREMPETNRERILEATTETVLRILAKRMKHPFPGVDLELILEKTGSRSAFSSYVYRVTLRELEKAGRIRKNRIGIYVTA